MVLPLWLMSGWWPWNRRSLPPTESLEQDELHHYLHVFYSCYYRLVTPFRTAHVLNVRALMKAGSKSLVKWLSRFKAAADTSASLLTFKTKLKSHLFLVSFPQFPNCYSVCKVPEVLWHVFYFNFNVMYHALRPNRPILWWAMTAKLSWVFTATGLC